MLGDQHYLVQADLSAQGGAVCTLNRVLRKTAKSSNFGTCELVKELLTLASLIKAFPTDAGLSAVETTDQVRQVAQESDDDPKRRYFPSIGRDGRF